MWNFFTSKMMVASLLGASSVFGQNCKPVCEPVCCEPHELLQCPTVAGYNSPARIDIQCGWDVWVDASFIYWQAIQENMEPAYSHVPGVTLTLGTNSFGFVNMDFKYKPGFKVGAGMSFDYDNWDAGFEYTRLHQTTHSSAAMSLAAATAGDGYIPLWININNAPLSTLITSFKASWKLNLDFLDVDMGRWFYMGTQLTMRPAIGMRAAWINQHRSATYNNILNTALNNIVSESTHSWGIGPRASWDMNWMIGCGFRFFGNNSADLLFTRYHATSNSSNQINGATILETDVKESHINTLRPHVDLEWGLGWGTYLCNHEWYVDINAAYGFQIFWNQDMFRRFTSPTNIRTLMPYGDLFVHGLTVTVKLDF
jgi:hypothetical protein